MDQRIAAALAAGLMLQASYAFADASATASFSNITVELIDLQPDDGIAPAVTFYGTSAAQTVTEYPPLNQISIVPNVSATSFGPASATSPASPYSRASASFAGDVYQGTGTATASAWAMALTQPYGAVAAGIGEVLFGDAGSPTATGFVLSPRTELVISGWADLEGEVTPGGVVQQTFCNFGMSIDADTSAGPQHTDARLSATLDGTSPATSVIAEEQLSVSFSNIDATPASGYFLALLSADATTAVPELPPAPLLLTALAAMLLRADRRRHAPA